MRKFIDILEKYSSDNAYLLRHLNNSEFDYYRHWSLICLWAEENDHLGDFELGDDAVVDDASTLNDYDPEVFLTLPEWQRREAIEWATEYLERHDPSELPSNHYLSAEKKLLPRDTWLVHFTDHAGAVVANGFTHGTSDVDALGLTTYTKHEAKSMGGYNFAFEAGSRHALWAAQKGKYGKQAVMFMNSGVKAWHSSDEEDQIIFWGPEVDRHSIIRLFNEYGDWSVHDVRTNRPIVTGDFEKVVDWVMRNTRQYARALFL
jgi:hypothetical protein